MDAPISLHHGEGEESRVADRLGRIKNHSFFKYAWIGAFFSVLNIFFLWLFIDIFGIPTLISSTIIIGGLFALKYLFYRLTGLITG
jgi:putative flippase GtrA